MSGIVLFAKPWWVNFLILIPAVPYLLSRKEKIQIGKKHFLATALFAIAFGFVEAVVVVYLRAAAGLLAGDRGKPPMAFPMGLITIEYFREAATMIMLGAIAWLAGQSARQKVVAFLWTFAFWDIFYYVWLHLTIGWPTSLLNPDLLFLIPVPWVSQVWFPILVSSLTILVIWLSSLKKDVGREEVIELSKQPDLRT